MRKLGLINLFLVLLFSSLALVSAQEFVVEDNACLTGGVMEGKCDLSTAAEDDWAWTCGWYVHRYYTGEFTRDDVIDTCRGLIPLPTTPTPSCLLRGNLNLCLFPPNWLRQDNENDGIFDYGWYIITGTVAGDDNNCPAGTIYLHDIGYYQAADVELYNWFRSLGFGDFDGICMIP